jgi:hypothetical protein
VEAPRWTDSEALAFAAAVKTEADGTMPLVVRTLGGGRHEVAGGSGWATAVDLRQFVAKAAPAAWELGAAEQLTLMAGSAVVDPHFYTSEARAQMVRGELPAEIVVVFGGGVAGGRDGGGSAEVPARLLSTSSC